MIKELSSLNEEEQNLLINAPALITLLVAGADNKIEQKEMDWGGKVAHFRSTKEGTILHDYYHEVDKNFTETLQDFLANLPTDPLERNKAVSNELSKLNDIFAHLDNTIARELYKSFLTFAEQIAKASGGLLGYASVSPEEEEMMKLIMIKPVE